MLIPGDDAFRSTSLWPRGDYCDGGFRSFFFSLLFLVFARLVSADSQRGEIFTACCLQHIDGDAVNDFHII